MRERPLDFLKKICYNKRKRHFYRPGQRGPTGLILYKKYDIIYGGSFKPVGASFSGKYRRICHFTFNRKNFHMGCTGRKLGPWHPPAARSFVSRRIWGGPTGLSGKNSYKKLQKNDKKKFRKHLTFWKFGLIRPLSARRLYHTWPHLSIGKMHKKK